MTNVTRTKLLNLALVVSSLFGYLEWGQGQRTFLGQAEVEIVTRALTAPMSVIHPFVVVPIAGQLALFATLFQASPSRWLTYAGIAGVGLLLTFMLFIGVISLNPRIIAGSVPFVAMAFVTIRHLRSTAGPQ